MQPSPPGGLLIIRRDRREIGSLCLVTKQHPQGLAPRALITPGVGVGLVLTARMNAELAEEGLSCITSLLYSSSC